jgi:hypothetical protein
MAGKFVRNEIPPPARASVEFSTGWETRTNTVYQIGAVARRALGGNDGSEQPKLASAQNGFTLNLGELERRNLLSRVSAVVPACFRREWLQFENHRLIFQI